ncbi:MAG: GTP cyclohydrolase II [Saprospiraceae bacterium]|nr:GTP cyclohydrolase II [Saprospiraceae bacterium]
MHRIAEAWIPTEKAKFKMITYSHESDDRMPNIAFIHENADVTKPVYVRIHSECLTGDLFGSLRCDCGPQLEKSKEIIAKKEGIIIYLRQEGRGIGLIKKLEAYNLQDQGIDTVDANLILGFHSDERDYSDALDILKDLMVKEIILLTNNPDKMDAFDGSGINILRRESLIIKSTNENEKYLQAKKDRMGHMI